MASILQESLNRPGFVTVAVGFNPIAAMKGVRVDGWEGSFHGVLQVFHREVDHEFVMAKK